MDVLFFFLLAIAAASQNALGGESPQVDIPGLGKVVGDTGISFSLKRPYYMYKGIRYALSPSGERRFQPPVPAGGWEGVLEAKSFGQMCPQPGLTRESRLYGGWETLEAVVEEELVRTGEIKPESERAYSKDVEDCLFVHIYTTKVGVEAKMPVMVFFHGGGFKSGSANMYGAQRFMDEDVVLVVPHYRLGPLGFMSLQTDDIPGNAGMMDQVLALKWVRDHISHFGGDPNLVTIFGQSAGAVSVSYMMLSPMAKGLFHRVIGQSGSSLADWAIDMAPEYHALDVASIAGCNTTDDGNESVDMSDVTKCLQTIDAMKLTEAYQIYRVNQEKLGNSGFDGCNPIIQRAGREIFMDKHPLEVMKSGNYSNVPIMFGANKHEGSYLLAIVYDGYMLPNGVQDDEDYLSYRVPDYALRFIHTKDPNFWLVDSISNKYVKDEYLGNFTMMTPGLIDYFGTVFFKGPSYRKVQMHSQMNNSYFYAFNYRGKNTMWGFIGDPNAPFDGGVCHTNDLMYLFDISSTSLDDEEKEVARKMVGLWTNFATYGEPNPEKSKVDGVPTWLPYTSKDEFYMRFEKNFTAQQNFKKEYTIAMDEAESANNFEGETLSE